MNHLRKLLFPCAALGALAFAATAFAGPPAPPGPPPPPGPGHTLYVGHGSTGNNKNCSSPGYSSVQAAVDAAAKGNTVYLCGGQFSEQVFVNKDLMLTGDPGSGLTAAGGTTYANTPTRYPAAFANDDLFLPQALLVITDGNVNVTGLTISGPLPSGAGCAEQDFGILGLGGNVQLHQDSVLNIADANPALYGCQFGVGIQIGREYWPTADFGNFLVENFNADGDIDHVTVSGYMKNGITIDAAGSHVNVHNSTVTGGGPYAPFGDATAQNGIQISRGAQSDVHDNNVSANQYTGGVAAVSTGILVFGGCGDPLELHTMVHNNTLSNNDVGVYLDNETDACDGTPSATPTKLDVHNNNISSGAVTNRHGDVTRGYQAGIADIGNGDNIHDNTISGTGYQPEDDSTAFVTQIDTSGAINAKVTHNKFK